MKTNSTIKRLSALILTGSIAVFTAAAANTTPAADKAAAITPAPAAPAAKADAARPAAAKHHRKHHHTAVGTSITNKSAPIARDGLVWFGAVAENAKAPAGFIHRSASDVRLTKVYPGSPACNAGLRAGGIVWKFDGERLTNTAQFQRELRDETPGATVPVEILRHGKREELKVKLGVSHTARALPAGNHVLIIS